MTCGESPTKAPLDILSIFSAVSLRKLDKSLFFFSFGFPIFTSDKSASSPLNFGIGGIWSASFMAVSLLLLFASRPLPREELRAALRAAVAVELLPNDGVLFVRLVLLVPTDGVIAVGLLLRAALRAAVVV
jgi:hypothetical protein